MKPWNEPYTIFGSIFVVSFIAVGENNMNTPIRHISNKSKKGMNLNKIEGILDMYFWSIFGPQA